MIDVPDFAKDQFPDGYEILWAERRAVFEIVYELAESLYLLWTILSITVWISWWFEYSHPYYWLGVLFFSILAMRKGFEEYKRWQYEIHVIVVAQGIGYYYKFSGWLDRNPAHETITAVSPGIVGPKQTLFERLWGWSTGEQMARISLSGASGLHLNARRIHPSIDKAIQNVRGGRKGPELPEPSANLADAKTIGQLIDMKKLDPDLGLPAIETLVKEGVWGRL